MPANTIDIDNVLTPACDLPDATAASTSSSFGQVGGLTLMDDSIDMALRQYTANENATLGSGNSGTQKSVHFSHQPSASGSVSAPKVTNLAQSKFNDCPGNIAEETPASVQIINGGRVGLCHSPLRFDEC